MSNLIESLNWRYATKNFDSSKKLSDDQVNILAESLRLSASSFGLQPWKFIFVSNDDTKKELLAHSWHQQQVVDCSHQIVFCYNENFGEADVQRFLEDTAKTRGVDMESLAGYGDVMKGFISRMDSEQKAVWMKNQVYIALGSFLVSCAELKIDACPMEGIVQGEYDKVLGLKDGWKSVVACPVGFRAADDKYSDLAKVRFPMEEVVDIRK
ncbi:NAD(P)H-dependent oxidoreductase [Halobacteriovorax marinus]|uniref:NAD(P)H-dependent oxidoreductase n=1 Tax=Halobacteriovorax marinus TaxID=97084 RepID=A0A1Y5FJL5_9BACT|nr:NAD(P)H-dependent oxidoreductase [Halobacteriovorax marinus]